MKIEGKYNEIFHNLSADKVKLNKDEVKNFFNMKEKLT